MERDGRQSWIWAGGATGVALISVATMVLHGWVPMDEGAAVLSAWYVTDGALPHHDFSYPYTGALPYVHALGLRLFGDTMASMRYTLVLAFAAWLPAVWIIVRRFVSAPIAALVLVTAAWWSLYVYPAAVPTWYLLFLTTWSLLAIAKWGDAGQTGWLIVAGLACGVAITLKQTGLYTLVGAGLGVLAYDQAGDGASIGTAADGTHRHHDGRLRPWMVWTFLGIGAIGPCAIALTRGAWTAESILLAAPLLAVLGALALREHRVRQGASDRSGQWAPLLRAWAVLGAGAAVPVVMLVAWYAWHGALPGLADGLVRGTLASAATIDRPMPPLVDVLGMGAPLIVVAAVTGFARSRWVRIAAGVASAFAICAAAYFRVPAYLAVWYFAMLLLPVLATGTAAVARTTSLASRDVALVVAIAAAAALLALNQYPYAAPNYFGFVAPLVIVLGASLAGVMTRDPAGRGPGVLRAAARSPFALATLLLFGGWFHRIGSVETVGTGSVWIDSDHPLAGPYGGLSVTSVDSASYDRIAHLIKDHGGADSLIAGPELPELFALTGRRSVVWNPYLLAGVRPVDSATIATAVDTSAVRIVAINHEPLFVDRVSAEARSWLARRYPHAERVGPIELRWR